MISHECLLGIWLYPEQYGIIKSQYQLYGYPNMVLTDPNHPCGLSLYTRPSTVLTICKNTGGHIYVDGVVCGFHNGKSWVGQEISMSIERFLTKYDELKPV